MRYKTRPEIRRPGLGIASILRQKQVGRDVHNSKALRGKLEKAKRTEALSTCWGREDN